MTMPATRTRRPLPRGGADRRTQDAAHRQIVAPQRHRMAANGQAPCRRSRPRAARLRSSASSGHGEAIRNAESAELAENSFETQRLGVLCVLCVEFLGLNRRAGRPHARARPATARTAGRSRMRSARRDRQASPLRRGAALARVTRSSSDPGSVRPSPHGFGAIQSCEQLLQNHLCSLRPARSIDGSSQQRHFEADQRDCRGLAIGDWGAFVNSD